MQKRVKSITSFRNKNPIFLIIGMYLILMPYFQLPGIGYYNSKRVVEIFILVVIVFGLLVREWVNDKNVFKINLETRHFYLLYIFIAFGVISIVVSGSHIESWREIFMMFGLIWVIILLGASMANYIDEFQKYIVYIAVLFASVYTIFFLGNYFSAHINDLIPYWPDRIGFKMSINGVEVPSKEVLYFVHRRFFNHIQTWTFPLLISAAIWIKTTKPLRYLILMLLTLWWVMVLASGARGTTVALIVSCVFVYYKYRESCKNYLMTFVYTACAGSFTYFVMYYLFAPNTVGVSLFRSSSSGRLWLWEKALSLFAKHPILGIGPYNYALINKFPSYAHPHNFYLQILSEWGIVVFGVMVYVLINVIQWLISDFDKVDGKSGAYVLNMGILGSFIAALTHAFVSGVFHTPMSQIWLILIGSYLYGYYLKQKSLSKIVLYKPYNSKHQFLLRPVFVVSLIGLVIITLIEVTNIDKRNKIYREKFNVSKYYPRFWGQGLIWN